MPWCPKCKNEYVEGVTTCADCGCELVDSLEDIGREGLIFGSGEEMRKLYDFLISNGIDSARIEPSEQDGPTELFVSGEQKERASHYLMVFLRAQEAQRASGDVQGGAALAQGADEDGTKGPGARAGTAAKVYEAASQKAENFRSGAYTLLVSGILGLILLACALAGLLPIRFTGASRYLTGGVMGALFLVFVVMGVLSLRSSRVFEGKAKEESALKEELRRWCRDNLSADIVDAAVPDLPEAEEERYYKREEAMRKMISDNFLNLEPGYLENFVEEIYPEYFE